MNKLFQNRRFISYMRNTLIISLTIIIILFLVAVSIPVRNSGMKKKILPVKEIEIAIEVIKENEKTKTVVEKKKIPKDLDSNLDDKKESKEEVENGALPPISANYRKYLGFRKYAKEVEERGGCFIIMGGSSKNIYQINFNSGSLQKVDIATLKKADYSSRSRVITDEPALNNYRDIAEEKYNLSNPEVILLVPNKYEKYIAAVIANSGISTKNISSFKGYYKVMGNDFILLLNKATYMSGETEIIDLKIKL
jgi:hypothetical protein